MPDTRVVFDCETGEETIVDLTPQEIAARNADLPAHQAAQAAADTGEANRATLRDKANTALTTNATYLAITSPNAAQNTAQAKALTRQVNAIIKLMLGLLDDLNGT